MKKIIAKLLFPILCLFLFVPSISFAQYDARWRTDDSVGGGSGIVAIIIAISVAVAFIFGPNAFRWAVIQFVFLFGFPVLGGLLGKEIAGSLGAIIGGLLALILWAFIWVRMK
jgi:hypothetical protein